MFFYISALQDTMFSLENSEPFHLQTAAYSVQGKRPTMEDEHTVLLTEQCKKMAPYLEGDKTVFMAVYDGHGGKNTAKYVEQELPKEFLASFGTENYASSIQKSFLSLDEKLTAKLMAEHGTDGTTAVIAFIVDTTLYVANIGDSEAVLGKLNPIDASIDAIELSQVHKPRKNNEAERIRNLGGKVLFGRVDGELAVSRAFGDIMYKKPAAKANFVVADPFVNKIQLDRSCKYLILACDGLWDVMTHEEAMKFIDDCFSDGKTIQECAVEIVENALAKGSSDNISVVITKINWCVGDDEHTECTGSTGCIQCSECSECFWHTAAPNKAVTVENSQGFQEKALNSGKPVFPLLKILEIDPRCNFPLQKDTTEAPLYLKSLVGHKVGRSYEYLSKAQANICISNLHIDPQILPAWVAKDYICYKLFGEKGVKTLRDAEAFHKQFFVWATEFSNVHSTFVYHEKLLTIGGGRFRGPEQYFQYQKFEGTANEEKAYNLIANASAAEAYSLGHYFPVRNDWEDIKEKKMALAIKTKFKDPELAKLLAETSGNLLVQLSPSSPFWSTGPDGKGSNKLGEILMNLRDSGSA